MKKIFLAIVIGVLFVSCSNNQTDKKETLLTVSQLKQEKSKLMEANRKWSKAATPEDFFSFINVDALLM